MNTKLARIPLILLVVVLASVPLLVTAQNDPPQTDQPAVVNSKQQAADDKAAKKAAEDAKKAEEQARKKEEASRKKAEKHKNNDIDNIGNRNINKGQPNFTSIEKEIAIGKEASAEIEKQVQLVRDPIITEYVNRVGQNLVANSDAKVPFTIKVIDSDEINAFALPGGFFYVNTGVILAADDEAELAAVMAHEIAHVAARHAMENEAKGNLINIFSIPLIILGGPAGMAIRQVAQVAIPLKFIQFSKGAEAEADYLGVQYLDKTGYDPSAAVSFFEKLQAKEQAKSSTVSSMFSSHPPTEQRLLDTKTEIAVTLKPRDRYVVTTSEFQLVKNRLVALQANQAVQQDDKRPSLIRRRPGTNRPDDSDDKDTPDSSTAKPDDRQPSTDDRPVLQRRQ
jgi:predicted Zn-dependent protease